ncbi:MAG: hypothetical protein GXO23_00355 [Crenarchaeota archaeon]|nr:hypothetical protein [Thermoproteota archaeon]
MSPLDVKDMVERLVADAPKLRVNVEKRDRIYIIDCGVATRPGPTVGKIVSEITMSGLGEVNLHPPTEQSLPFPLVNVVSDDPVAACLCSQAAMWVLKCDSCICYVSGPGRVLANKPRSFLERLREFADHVMREPIFIVECLPVSRPPDDVLKKFAELVPSGKIYVIVISARSPAGVVQICSRIVEVALFRIIELVNPRSIISGLGSCPVPPPREDVYAGIAVCNDCIRYVGNVLLMIEGDVKDIDNILKSAVTKEDSQSFLELMRAYGPEFLTKASPEMFTVAELTVFSGSLTRRSGRKHIDKILDYLKVVR